MAWTKTKVAEYAAGNHQIQHWVLVADSAVSELVTGLKNIVHVTQGFGSIATASRIRYNVNVLSGATAQGGAMAIISAASGDHVYLTVVGN